MKTPREILSERHRPAEPRLDAIRRDLVGKLNNQETKPQGFTFVSWLLRCPQNFWCELIWPARRIWTGLAAAWLLILVANLHLSAGSPRMAAATSLRSADFILAFREQEQVLAELTDRAEPKVVEPPKQFVPQPRSERRVEMKA